ncbi:hypothetical protein BW14_05945 [Bifidobacterium sp. UTBIF-68]|nr:hypothetical protein BW14_05945 [Bifidobacterium sp. UTBIF-68]
MCGGRHGRSGVGVGAADASERVDLHADRPCLFLEAVHGRVHVGETGHAGREGVVAGLESARHVLELVSLDGEADVL